MTAFLFWNLNRKPLQHMVSNLARRHAVDVLMLAECEIEVDVLLTLLNQSSDSSYHYTDCRTCRRVKVFTRFPGEFLSAVCDTDRLTVRHLRLPGLRNILVAVTHFPDKGNFTDEEQSHLCTVLARQINDAEQKVGHSNTVLTGDFNMNPFDPGVVSALGLHGVMSRRIAEERSRRVQKASYAYFYNPMWSLLGDRTSSPPGTYYYRGSTPVVYFWNMFDQVLLRPDLLPFFATDELKILDSDGATSLLSKRGYPDHRNASDHLPIFFRLAI